MKRGLRGAGGVLVVAVLLPRLPRRPWVSGLGVFEADPLPLVGLDGVALDLLGQGASLDFTAPAALATVDLLPFAVYSGVAEFDPLVNVDVGAFVGSPSSGYAAAGSTGLWNTIGLGTTALLTTTGVTSAVTATLATASDAGFGPGSPPDAQALMGDFGADCNSDAWSLDFAGLPNGVYRLFLYAPSSPGVSTGDVFVPQGELLADLPGSSAADLLPGVSSVRTEVVVSDGQLQLSGQGSGAIACAGVAGVQLERQRPSPKAPVLAFPGLVVLASLLLGAGRARGRRRLSSAPGLAAGEAARSCAARGQGDARRGVTRLCSR